MMTPLSVLGRALLSQSPTGGFWFPDQASKIAPEIDWVYHFILYVSAVFFVIICFFMFYLAAKYRRRPGVEPVRTASHSTALELSWSVLPSILLVFMFYFGVTGYMDMRSPPDDAYEIHVTARKWSWGFTYPNGFTSPDLHVPIDEPVRLLLDAEDVLHSFFVPAFRVKMDAVPGRYTKLWFTATQAGEHQIFCTEYCGTQHSEMLAKAIVHPAGEFEKWLSEASDIFKGRTPVQVGELLVKSNGCMACHSVDGTRGIGPTWKGAFGKPEMLADKKTVTVDENYIKTSILEPMAQIVDTYAPAMPTYKGKLKDKEIDAIISYIKSLSDAAPAPGPAPKPGDVPGPSLAPQEVPGTPPGNPTPAPTPAPAPKQE